MSRAPVQCCMVRSGVTQYGDHYRFAAAGGIRLNNIREIADQTGAHECHVGTAAQTDGVVDAAKVRALRAAPDA